jgi:hypothetical protein
MIPLILRLRIGSAGRNGFGLWLPVFLVWILLFTIFLLLLPFMILAEVILAVAGKYIPITGIFWHTLMVMTKLPGTEIHVKNPHGKNVDISIY